MSHFSVKNLPHDLQQRLHRLKDSLQCSTWVDFLYNVVERVETQLREQEEPAHVGCDGCWYFSRLRTGDRLCNKTGELLDYLAYQSGCTERTEEPSVAP